MNRGNPGGLDLPDLPSASVPGYPVYFLSGILAFNDPDAGDLFWVCEKKSTRRPPKQRGCSLKNVWFSQEKVTKFRCWLWMKISCCRTFWTATRRIRSGLTRRWRRWASWTGAITFRVSFPAVSSSGSGSGLSMARQLFLQQNRTIEAGKGTTFRIRFYNGVSL